jgi:hypothetical protein
LLIKQHLRMGLIMNKRKELMIWTLLCAILPFIGGASGKEAVALEAQFRDPPLASRPSSFWPWIGGHITKEGIQADLAAMKASGMRGGILFDLSLYIPEGGAAYGSQEWQDLVDYAISTGHGMGLEIGFQNCPGWATSGGPWVKPEDSMKRMVYSETKVSAPGGSPIRLAMPDIKEDFYRDVAVLAIKDKVETETARITFNGGDVSGLQGTGPQSPVPILSGEPAVFEFAFDAVTAISSWGMDLIGNAAGAVDVTIESSVDGKSFASVAKFNAGGRLRGRTPLTQSFDPVEGRIFRVTMIPPFNRGNVTRFQVASLNLLPDARIPNYAMLSLGSSSAARQFHSPRMPSTDAHGAIDPAKILDLTDRLGPDGNLTWEPPSGAWTLLRFGYTSTGAKNHPARQGGEGLEVDKMNAEAVRRFFAAALVPVLERSKGKISVIGIDSWEAGTSNWTDQFPQEFKRLRGYDIQPFLPVLTGRIVGSPAESYAFLQDFRVTVTDLVAENYHRVMQEEAHRHGARLSVEPYPGWNMDEFKSSQYADRVMAEFWVHDIGAAGAFMSSVRRTSAMVETIQNEKILSSEAFTGRPADAGWRQTPRTLKRVADSALVNGVNDFTFHSFVHQPRDDMRPGFMHGRYGTEFGRHNTWWPMAGAFNDYLARSGLMLRQGNRMADFLFMKNEGTFMDDRFPDVPPGYEFLYIAPFTLLESKVDNGMVVTPGGGRHALLVLPSVWVADLPLLEKLRAFKEAGVTVLGAKPVMPAGRNDLQQLEKWNALVGEIFPPTARFPTTVHLTTAAQARGIGPDFSFDPQDAPLEYAHRRAGNLDIYFVRNAESEPVKGRALFRVSSDRAQFWNPLDGSVLPAPVTVQDGAYSAVSIDLPPLGSTFVVFGAGGSPSETRAVPAVAAEIEPQGWKVTFRPPSGKTFTRDVGTLALWNESEDDAVKYFSGTAVYEGAFKVPALTAGSQVVIDLGIVHDMARVRVNGKAAGVCWTPPDRLDITALVKPGTNRLEIEVANTWVNRLIGDESLPTEAEYDGMSANAGTTAGVLTKFPDWYRDPAKAASRQRSTFAAWRHYDQNSPLVPSGLAGPVTVKFSVDQ